MNKTQIVKELTELFSLFKSINDPSNPKDVELPFEDMTLNRTARIYSYFGLEPTERLDDLMEKFLERDQLTPQLLEQVITQLSQIAVEHLSQPVLPLTEEYQPTHSDNSSDNNNSSPDVVSEMRVYVMKNILIPLTDEEFTQIERGFRLLWNVSTGKMIGEDDIERWVSQYLLSVECHVDQKKVEKVVDLILEYMEEIGRWG